MTQENLKEMRERITHLHRFLLIDDKLAKLENDRQLTLSPGFWDDNARATAILKEIKIDKYWTEFYEQVKSSVEDFAILHDFWKEGEATEEEVKEAYDKAIKELDELEFKSTLNEPEDEMPAMLVITPVARVTSRTRLFCSSAMKRCPLLSTATAWGALIDAFVAVAWPPSPP